MTALRPLSFQDRKAGNDDGFSLVEVIVALAILALLAAMLPGTIRLAQRSWQTIGDLSRAGERAAARTFLEHRLSEAMPVLVISASGTREPAFRGEPGRLSFAAPSAAGPAGGGLYLMTLTADATEDGPGLVLRQRILEGSAGTVRDDETRVLISGTGEFGFRYFGKPRDAVAARWQENWTDGERLPDLIEIAAQPDRARSQLLRFAPLVVALKLRRAS